MQVGFSPVSFQQRQNKTQNTNFGTTFDNSAVKLFSSKPDRFIGVINDSAFDCNKQNKSVLKQVVSKIKERCEAKWDLPDIKEAIFKAWGQDDELKEMFKGY